ncbi:SDR family NAD(P)-dependent oxidoreductase [Croceibacterium aestuarii]|uniref:SDR family NAD(P)-dependent oxidoreductase n=1 Tax=Croceibacterium aestuarii TaxID=3064139 RepID=UPI00272E5C78|nr:SDR family NAD(P)-dependent oxidoreductase [Croceibacterium sp. D39]
MTARETGLPGPLAGKVAILTGAGSSLGKSHALYLAAQGARVVVNDVAFSAAGAAVDAIVEAGGEAIAATGSVTDEQAVAQMVTDAITAWGAIDILVNNAGVLRDKSFAKMALEDFRHVLDVHLMGAAICTKAVWEPMRANSGGRIVFTTSSSGLWGNFGQSNYGAAKMALVGLMQTLSIEGTKHDIRVNCLAPTAATQMTEGIWSEEDLADLSPSLVSPGLLPLVIEDAPTRAILCAGAGHFARAEIMLTPGVFLGFEDDPGEALQSKWTAVGALEGAVVPENAMAQSRRELASKRARTV